jgi:hypothetical protein
MLRERDVEISVKATFFRLARWNQAANPARRAACFCLLLKMYAIVASD